MVLRPPSLGYTVNHLASYDLPPPAPLTPPPRPPPPVPHPGCEICSQNGSQASAMYNCIYLSLGGYRRTRLDRPESGVVG
jgi:hypothetical protein